MNFNNKKQMKTLKTDGSQVTERSYYFLLDWVERDENNYIFEQFQKLKLSELTFDEYTQLLGYAFKEEILIMQNNNTQI